MSSFSVEKMILEDVFPFWDRMIDLEKGGFFSTADNAGQITPEANKGLVQHGRVLWSYSAAHEKFPGRGYDAKAEHAYDFLMDKFKSKTSPGWYYQVARDGSAVDKRNHMYALGFAVYGLAKYGLTSGSKQAKIAALATFELIEQRGSDKQHGGYYECFDEEFNLLGQIAEFGTTGHNKTMNSHIHIMEAYTTLYELTHAESVASALKNLIDIILDRVLDRRSSRLELFFKPDWTVVPAEISYGHDIETAWLLLEAAQMVHYREDDVKSSMAAMADKALSGLDEVKGGLFYEGERSSGRPKDFRKVWWVQAEGVTGWLQSYLIHKDERFLAAAANLFKWILEHQIDRQHGDWFETIYPDGKVSEKKASVWKTPYHNGRALMHLLEHEELLKSVLK